MDGLMAAAIGTGELGTSVSSHNFGLGIIKEDEVRYTQCLGYVVANETTYLRQSGVVARWYDFAYLVQHWDTS
jgi:hypothetical protein